MPAKSFLEHDGYDMLHKMSKCLCTMIHSTDFDGSCVLIKYMTNARRLFLLEMSLKMISMKDQGIYTYTGMQINEYT